MNYEEAAPAERHTRNNRIVLNAAAQNGDFNYWRPA